MQVLMTRMTVISSRPFAEVVERLSARIGHPDLSELQAGLGSGNLEELVHSALAGLDFMEFARYDAGRVLRQGPGILRLVIGNPLIMQEMVRRVPDAAAYAPVTLLVHERPDGVHLSYDSMASLLAPYGNAQASAVARDLDSKIECLLEEVK